MQNYLSAFCKKVKMESSKRTMVVLLAREKRAITNYYIIKPYLQQKNLSDVNPTVEKQHLAL
jgi:hypothetical protein